jgi:nucleotidyltransferase substrate binding protein (TIGR01987 family)
MTQDVRWKQRFQNFERAFLFLKKAVELGNYDELQGVGLIRSFEFTFELAWKTLKDYLIQQGLDVQYPRDVIKESFATALIDDGKKWITMLDKRNELSHTYNQEQAQKAIKVIREEYYPSINQLYNTLKERCLD